MLGAPAISLKQSHSLKKGVHHKAHKGTFITTKASGPESGIAPGRHGMEPILYLRSTCEEQEQKSRAA